MANPWDSPATPADTDLASTLGQVIRGLKPDLPLISQVVVPHNFGGFAGQAITQTSYLTGSTLDKLAPNTDIIQFDSADLPSGTYKLRAILAADTGTATLGLFNLTDAPNTPIIEVTGAVATGVWTTSAAISFAAAGASKVYGVKVKVTGGNAWVWGINLIRTP